MSKSGSHSSPEFAVIRIRAALQSERDEMQRTIEEMRRQGCQPTFLEARLAEIDEYLEATLMIE